MILFLRYSSLDRHQHFYALNTFDYNNTPDAAYVATYAHSSRLQSVLNPAVSALECKAFSIIEYDGMTTNNHTEWHHIPPAALDY